MERISLERGAKQNHLVFLDCHMLKLNAFRLYQLGEKNISKKR